MAVRESLARQQTPLNRVITSNNTLGGVFQPVFDGKLKTINIKPFKHSTQEEEKKNKNGPQWFTAELRKSAQMAPAFWAELAIEQVRGVDDNERSTNTD